MIKMKPIELIPSDTLALIPPNLATRSDKLKYAKVY